MALEAAPERRSLLRVDHERGSFQVDRAAFTDPEILRLERDRVFQRTWLYAGHESEIAHPGDFRAREVAGRPIVLVRDSDGIVRVLLNTCTHRGAEVCRDECGNTKTFQCAYHGWTYDTRGALIGVPSHEAYACLRKEELGLASPRAEIFRGFVFVAFDKAIEPLADYLGETAEYFDFVLDQAPSGWEVIRGVQRYEVRANWKLLVENSIDIYHLPTVHKRFVDFVRRPGIELPSARRLGIARDLGRGHAVVENPPTGGRPVAMWHPDFGEENRAAIEALRAEIEARVGAERAHKMADTNRNLFLFPNLVLLDAASVVIRTLWPLAPDRMEVTTWTLGPRHEPEALRRVRLRNAVMFLGPGGFGTPDDCAIVESCQRGFANLEVRWSDVSRGMKREAPLHTDEAQMRAFLVSLGRADAASDIMMTSQKRVAVVTAAANGIGAALVERLAVAGRDLGLLDIDGGNLEKVAARAKAHGVNVVAQVRDVLDPSAVREAFEAFRSELGPIDILANVVGGSVPSRPVEEISDEEWESVLTLNLRGLFHCTRAVVPDMKARRWGRIVNTSSVAGRTRSLFGGANYTAAKGAVIGFTRHVGAELAPYGIAVNVVAPGVTMSERVAQRIETMPVERREYIRDLIPAGRFASADEVAAALAFFCSDDAGYVCGAVLDVNGGLFIG